MKFFERFAEKHPKAARWIREGGLFLIFSYVITFLKYLMLLFLPKLFSAYAGNGFGWPGIEGSLFGMAYMFANLVSSLLGECVNFPLQRNFTFRSKGPLKLQIPLYFTGWFVIFLVVNAINSVWVGVAKVLLPAAVYNIGTTVLTGGVAMVVFFVVNKIIFAEGFGERKKNAK